MDDNEKQALRDLRRNLLRLTKAIEAEAKQAGDGGDGSGAPGPDVLSNLSDRQVATAAAELAIVDDFGQYDQSTGPDGACYWDGTDNPYSGDGLMCQNCIFFQDPNGDPTDGDETCVLVSGSIDAEGLCKLWIIPGEELDPGDAEEDAASGEQ
jgi:hypothetical protein